MSGPNWKLEDDYKSVTLSLPTTPPAALKMDVAEVEEILMNLGEFRAVMKPEIPMTYAMGQKSLAIPDPAWVTETEMMEGNSVLHIRDPRYGWLHYLLPRAEARKLAGFLQAQVDAPSSEPETNKAN